MHLEFLEFHEAIKWVKTGKPPIGAIDGETQETRKRG